MSELPNQVLIMLSEHEVTFLLELMEEQEFLTQAEERLWGSLYAKLGEAEERLNG